MLESLLKQTSDFHLFIFAFDDISYSILKKLKPENTTIISLEEFETKELLEIKPSRSKGEYCWTCSSSSIAHVFEKYGVENCTYIDADLFFYSDPSILIKEMISKGKSVLITEHRFSRLARLYEEKRAGRFCVQFVTFLNDPGSLQILDKWRKQCIDWCYARYEDGKFGDQKYLDEWPDDYANVHILEHQGGGVAPWNIQDYNLVEIDEKLNVVNKISGIRSGLVFYHFQYVKTIETGIYDIGWYFLPESVIRLLYSPYLRKILEKERQLNELNRGFNTRIFNVNKSGFKNSLKNIFKFFTRYNIIKVK